MEVLSGSVTEEGMESGILFDPERKEVYGPVFDNDLDARRFVEYLKMCGELEDFRQMSLEEATRAVKKWRRGMMDDGKKAYCKYCYTVHSDWEWEGDFIWICKNCDHGMHDALMDVRR
jgi:hypothetical protein